MTTARIPAPTPHRRALVLLETANLVSGVSNALVMVTIPWLVLERTGSAAAAGLAGALAGLPGIVIAPVVGVLVDRLGRKTVSVGSDVLSAVSVGLFPIADRAGALDLGVILFLVLVGAAFDPAGYTGRKSLIPDVAAASGTGVERVNGIHEGVFAAGWVIGPVLGALGIAAVGPVTTMWFAFAAFAVAAGAVALLPVPNRARRHDGTEHAEEPWSWSNAFAGLTALRADRPVLLLTVAVAVVVMIYNPTESVLLPVHFESIDEPRAFGLLLSAIAAGAMVGAFGYGWVAARMTKHRIATVFLALACVAYVPIAFLPPLAVMLPAAFLFGLAWGPLNPLLNTLVQQRFPPEQHGRVYGIQLALFYAMPPLGQLVAGVSVARWGVQPVIAGVAVLLVLTAGVVSLQPTLRALDEPGPLLGGGRLATPSTGDT